MQQLAPNGGASQAGSTLPPGALDQPGAITGLMNGSALMPVHQAALCGVGGMSVVTPIGTMYPLAVGPGGVILPAKEMYMREKLLGALNLERLQEQSECTRTEMARLRQELETANILKREELENASKKRTLESACRELREIVELQASIEAGQEGKQHSKGQTPRHGNISAGACNGEVSVHTMERINNGNFQRAYGRGVEVNSILAASALKKGLYAMTVENIKGLDITLPLGELTLDIEEYQLHEDSDGYVLRAVRQKLHRNIDMSQQGKESLVILLSQSVNFFLEDHYDAHVFVIELLHRKRVIAWASVTAVESGIWESVLRRPPVDVSNSLYFTNDCLDSTLIGGKITRLRSGVSREINNYIKDPEPDGSPPVSEGPAGYPYRRSSCVPNIIYNSYECAERLPVISSHIGNAIKGTTNTAHSRGYAYLSPTTSTMTSGERTFGASQTNSEYCLPSILSNNYTPSAHAFRTQNFGIAMVNDQMGLQQSQGIMQRGNAVSPNASGTRYPDVSLVGSAMVNDQMGLQQSQGICRGVTRSRPMQAARATPMCRW
ncbi:hypothetical protein ERJ75_000878000 [Trypanosoma vivax]|nr:hypothetical protein ERJ75_000878000 [Trypanosoma vivax]